MKQVIKTLRVVDFKKCSLGFLSVCVLGLYGTAALVGPIAPTDSPTGSNDGVSRDSEVALTATAPRIDDAQLRTLAAIEPAAGESGMARATALAAPAEARVDRSVRSADLPRRPKVVAIDTRRVAEIFNRVDYRIDRVRAGDMPVPRILLASLPRDLRKARSPEMRKTIFLSTALPLILFKNEEIKTDRRRLVSLKKRLDAGQKVSVKDRTWLLMLAKRYRVDAGDLSELVKRVDVIPPSLALAQAAEESGWGTSRFAQEGNAIFGQWAWNGEIGIVPSQRKEGASHVIRAFDHLLDSARAYAHNLNTHNAYRELREKRSRMRLAGTALDGYELAGALTRYSERGEDYVETLRVIMRANDLQAFDGAELDKTDLSALLAPST